MGFGPKSEEAKTQGKKIGKNHLCAALNISFILRMTNASFFLLVLPIYLIMALTYLHYIMSSALLLARLLTAYSAVHNFIVSSLAVCGC